MNAKQLLETFVIDFEIKSKIKCAVISIQDEEDEEPTVILPIDYSNQEFREFKAALATGKTLDEDILGNTTTIWFLDGSWARYVERGNSPSYCWEHFKCPEIPVGCL